MRSLDGLSFGQRFLLTLAIILAILFALALFGYLTGGWDDAAAQQPLPPSKYDDRIAALDIEAIESAYKSQIEHLFEIWMKSAEGQPARALTGARNARKAFIGAMEAIERKQGVGK